MLPLKVDSPCSYRKIFRESHFTFNMVIFHYSIIITVQSAFNQELKKKVKWNGRSNTTDTVPKSSLTRTLQAQVQHPSYHLSLYFCCCGCCLRKAIELYDAGTFQGQHQCNAFHCAWVQHYKFAAQSIAYLILMSKFTTERTEVPLHSGFLGFFTCHLSSWCMSFLKLKLYHQLTENFKITMTQSPSEPAGLGREMFGEWLLKDKGRSLKEVMQ